MLVTDSATFQCTRITYRSSPHCVASPTLFLRNRYSAQLSVVDIRSWFQIVLFRGNRIYHEHEHSSLLLFYCSLFSVIIPTKVSVSSLLRRSVWLSSSAYSVSFVTRHALVAHGSVDASSPSPEFILSV